MKTTYPIAYTLKSNDLSWKDYYLMIVYYKDKMKREYNFDFIDGDAKKYYYLLTGPFLVKFKYFQIAEAATKIEDFKTLEYLFEINDFNEIKLNKLLDIASENNKTELVNYFIKKGASDFFKPFLYSAKNGNLEYIKKLFLKSFSFKHFRYSITY